MRKSQDHSAKRCTIVIYRLRRKNASYPGEENATPAFYSIRDLEIAGDSIFIADHKGFRIICMCVDGSVIWESGEQGKAPRHSFR
ncbi:MAG: hypothetical protein K8S15_07835 [Candidatus Aegiribacteria sp.]|nr:hypothetical protein [Candidatus Aegiribacteria sp.]